MPFGKKMRKFKTLTQQETMAGGSSQAEKRVALRLQASNQAGGLNDAEKNFVKGTANQDPARVRQVIDNARRANRKR